VKLGKIGAQLPKAGTKLAANGKVKLTVSLGPLKKHKPKPKA
jgi:beta-lactam-binding protein with PASTA domain